MLEGRILLELGKEIDRDDLLKICLLLVCSKWHWLPGGTFGVKSDTIEIIPMKNMLCIIEMLFGDEIEALVFYPISGKVIEEKTVYIFFRLLTLCS